MRIYCDIWTGQLRKSLSGEVVPTLNLFVRDILTLEVVFCDGATAVTSEVLSGNKVLKVGLRAQPGFGSLLALATDYVLNSEVASLTFSLNTTPLVSYFTNMVAPGQASVSLCFEIEVTASDGSTRQTYHQSAVNVRREVNLSTDTDPEEIEANLYVLRAALFDGSGRGISPNFLAYRSEITVLTGGIAGCLDAVITANLSPMAVLLRIGGQGSIWALVAGTDADNGVSIIRPLDFDLSTNAKVWKNIL